MNIGRNNSAKSYDENYHVRYGLKNIPEQYKYFCYNNKISGHNNTLEYLKVERI